MTHICKTLPHALQTFTACICCTREQSRLPLCDKSHVGCLTCAVSPFASILLLTSPYITTQASSCWRPVQAASSAHESPPRWSDIASSSGSRCVRLLIARSRRAHSACCASHRAMKLLLRWSCSCCMALQEYLLGLQGKAYGDVTAASCRGRCNAVHRTPQVCVCRGTLPK